MSLKISKRKQIFLVDDHTMVREGLAVVLTQAGFEICGQAASISETLAHPGLIFAHLAVIDLSLGEDSGLTLIKALADRKLSLLVYSMGFLRSVFKEKGVNNGDQAQGDKGPQA